MDIISLFDGSARKYPSKAFLRHEGRSHTYAQVRDLSHRAATVLAERGIRAGDRVAVMCFNTPGFIVAMLGAWRLNAVVVPVNHKMQAPEVDYILAHAQAKVCVFDGALAPIIDKLQARGVMLATAGEAPGYPSFDALVQEAPAMQGTIPHEDDLAQILYTSGTTGKPKGCLHSHRNVCQTAHTAALALSLTRDERTLVAMPLWHSSPLNNWMMGTLLVGATVVLLREYHPRHFLQTVQDERVTLYFGAPVSYLLPLQSVPDFDSFDLRSIRAWVYGGGPIGAEVAARLVEAYRSDRFFQVYGMTETGPTGTTLYPEEQLTKAGSIGRVSTPGIDMRVVREDGADAAPGEIGEIWLRADSVMQGYLQDPEATAAVLSEGWYRSGDLARLDAEGYLFVVDRSKDMIITGGENVYSKEVEDALSAHPAVLDVAVVGRPHPEWGETVVAIVVPQLGQAPDGDLLRSFLSEKLARFKIPREFHMSDSLPRTPTGKIMKHVLRQSLIDAQG